MSWKVNREGALLVGGGRALLLQVGHPLVAAGVVEHSDYDTDPWGRLYRTLDTTFKIAFGDPATREEAARRLRHAHARVKGTAPDGRPYAGQQPDLMLWVWATLLDSSLLVYQRYVGSLDREEIERFYSEQTRFLVACGGEEGSWPADYAEFARYFERMLETEVVPSDDSRRIAASVLEPDLPRPLRPLTAAVNLITVGTLPERLREGYGLEWSPRRERLLAGSTRAVRRMMPLIPSALRQLPASYASRPSFRPPGVIARGQRGRAAGAE